MAYTHFRPKSGRHGVQPIVTSFAFGANPFTVNNTAVFQIPTPPGRVYFSRAVVHCETVGNDADGTLLVRLFHRRASDDNRQQLTSDFNVEGLTARERKQLAAQAAVAEARKYFNDPGTAGNGDVLEADLVNNSAAIDTQPGELVITIEWFLQE